MVPGLESVAFEEMGLQEREAASLLGLLGEGPGANTQPLSSFPYVIPTGSPWTRVSVLAVHPGWSLPARGHVKEG